MKKRILNIGCGDDQTLYLKSGKKAYGVEAICYHNNPSSLKEVYQQSKWISSSYDDKIMKILFINFLSALFVFLLIPFLIFKNTILIIIRTKNLSFFNIIPFSVSLST